MSRRISSRDDLFLSALDMYTLLSLAFIGFAFFVAPSPDSDIADLPIARGGGNAESPERPTVQWTRGAAPQEATVSPTARCQIQVVERTEALGERVRTYMTGCVPRAFGGTLPAMRDLRLLADSALARPEVVILCRREEGLFACASLQWLMHEAGFRPLAGVSLEH